MTWWERTPVFYKILGAFVVALLMFAAFDVYLVSSLDDSKTLIAESAEQYATLNDLSTLENTNAAAVNAVNSYIVTGDPAWKTTYAQASTELGQELTALSEEPYLTSDDHVSILGLQDAISKREDTESTMIADLDEGNNSGTIQLFSSLYTTQQQRIAQFIGALIEDRNQEVSTLTGQNDATLSLLRFVAYFLYGLLFIIFVYLWFALSRSLVKPLERLTDAVKKFRTNSLEPQNDIPLSGIRESGDEVGQLGKAFHEMTERIQRDQAQFLSSVNSLPFGFILFDASQEPVLMNQIAKQLFSADVVTFDAVAKKFNEETKLLTLIHAVFTNGVGQTIPEANIESEIFRLSMEPVITPLAKRVIGAILVFENITEQKRLEQSKNAFLSIASHEMRTPLAVIRGNAELLLDDPAVSGNAAVKPLVESVVKASVQMLSIVDDFLDIQRLEENRIVLKIEPVDVIAAIKETIAELMPLAAEKKLGLVFEEPKLGEALPRLSLDKYRLQQIFMNIVSNGIHYTESGSVKVWIERRSGVIDVFFKDTGIGITAEDQKRLFRRFETGKTFIRSKEYGSGMGLYISRLLAHLMGGDLWLVSSEFGSGATFALTLPLIKVPMPPA